MRLAENTGGKSHQKSPMNLSQMKLIIIVCHTAKNITFNPATQKSIHFLLTTRNIIDWGKNEGGGWGAGDTR